MSTLLEKALGTPVGGSYKTKNDPDELELAVAYMEGRVGNKQVEAVVTAKNAASWAAAVIRRAGRVGAVKFSVNGNGHR